MNDGARHSLKGQPLLTELQEAVGEWAVKETRQAQGNVGGSRRQRRPANGGGIQHHCLDDRDQELFSHRSEGRLGVEQRERARLQKGRSRSSPSWQSGNKRAAATRRKYQVTRSHPQEAAAPYGDVWSGRTDSNSSGGQVQEMPANSYRLNRGQDILCVLSLHTPRLH